MLEDLPASADLVTHDAAVGVAVPRGEALLLPGIDGDGLQGGPVAAILRVPRPGGPRPPARQNITLRGYQYF